MGACVSIRKRHEGNPSRKSKKKVAHHSTTSTTTTTNNNNNNRKRRRTMKKRVSSCFCDRSKSGPFPDRSFSTPTFQGSTEEAWFDSTTRFDSDGEEDFQSVQDDILSQNGFERYHVGKHSHEVSSDRNSLSDLGRHSAEGKHPVFLHEISSAGGENTGKQDGLLDNCGILANNCLPCLTTSTVDSIERRKSLVGSPPSAKKKAASRHSFKGKDGLLSPRFASKMLLQRPMAGSQVPFCRIEKKVMNSWSHIEPNTFRVRGKNYFRDRKKESAPNYAAYYPFGVDVFLSPRKIEHIARFVDLPAVNSLASFPSVLIVNAQIPLYPATLFHNEADGEGISIVMYFKINECFAKELPPIFQESMTDTMAMKSDCGSPKGKSLESSENRKERVVVRWEDEDNDEQSSLSLCLVGKLWTIRRFNSNAFMKTMEMIWNPKHGLETKEIGTNLFLFQFFHWKDMERVTEGEPWFFEKCVVVLKPVIKGVQPSAMAESMTHAPFWVRVYDPPFEGVKEGKIRTLANSLGTYIKCDEECKVGWTKSIRFKALMDLREAFPDEITLERRDGKTISLNVKYEKLPNICYYCGRLGHVERDCAKKEENDDSGVVYQYGEWMRASPWKVQGRNRGDVGKIQSTGARKLVFKPEQRALEATQNKVDDVAACLLKVNFCDSDGKEGLEELTHKEEQHQSTSSKESQLETTVQNGNKGNKPCKTWHRWKRDEQPNPNTSTLSREAGLKHSRDDMELEDTLTPKKRRSSIFSLDNDVETAAADEQPRRDQ